MARGETYEQFVEKFKPKLTTDDCYTPPGVKTVIADYVRARWKGTVGRDVFVDPFVPGGDYKGFCYSPNMTVVANPPFSILSQILNFYLEKGVKFFLFAPALTALQAAYKRDSVSVLYTGKTIVYTNGARVATAFVTNLEQRYRVMIDSELGDKIKEANTIARHPNAVKEKPGYPRQLISSAALEGMAKHGFKIDLEREKTAVISYVGGTKGRKIFGAGVLMSVDTTLKLRETDARAKEAQASAKEAQTRRVEFTDIEREILARLNNGEVGQA